MVGGGVGLREQLGVRALVLALLNDTREIITMQGSIILLNSIPKERTAPSTTKTAIHRTT
jgi:hypothetical protein